MMLIDSTVGGKCCQERQAELEKYWLEESDSESESDSEDEQKEARKPLKSAESKKAD